MYPFDKHDCDFQIGSRSNLDDKLVYTGQVYQYEEKNQRPLEFQVMVSFLIESSEDLLGVKINVIG